MDCTDDVVVDTFEAVFDTSHRYTQDKIDADSDDKNVLIGGAQDYYENQGYGDKEYNLDIVIISFWNMESLARLCFYACPRILSCDLFDVVDYSQEI